MYVDRRALFVVLIVDRITVLDRFQLFPFVDVLSPRLRALIRTNLTVSLHVCTHVRKLRTYLYVGDINHYRFA
jgi:hypothetical protein